MAKAKSSFFTEMKKNKKSNFEKLAKELEKTSNPTFQKDEDERMWYPSVDKAGNGVALIRFLPAPPGEDIPFVRVFSHGFQGPTGSWYIENSLTTIGKDDPVSEYNTELWNTGIEADKETARKQKRKLNFYSNVYVIKDPMNPENEGKVFLFRYGKKIWDKINRAINPPDAESDEIKEQIESGLLDKEDIRPAFDPFDLWEGANFRMKIKNVAGYRNYDDSKFMENGPLFNDDAELEKVWNAEYPLQEFLSPEKFKSYGELKVRLHRVLGLNESAPGVEDLIKSGIASVKAKETTSVNNPKETESELPEDDDIDLDFLNTIEIPEEELIG